MKPDTPQRYGTTTRFLHWTMAACYLFMFATAIAWNMDESLKFLINPHKAVGFFSADIVCLACDAGNPPVQQSTGWQYGCQIWTLGNVSPDACRSSHRCYETNYSGRTDSRSTGIFVVVLVSGTHWNGCLPLHQRQIRAASNARKILIPHTNKELLI